MNIKYLNSILALAAATFAAVLPTGTAYASSGRGTQFDTYCATPTAWEPVGTTVPRQSRPYLASNRSCSKCHTTTNEGSGDLNTLGRAVDPCSGNGALASACKSATNSFCVNSPPTGAPTITAPAAGTSFSAGSQVTFTGSGGTDPDGFPLVYSWSFTNGIAPVSGQSVTVIAPATGGTLTATLEVRDAIGAAIATKPTRSITVTAPNQAPNGSITVPQNIVQNQAVTFTGSGTDPETNLPLTYLWNFGTGATPATSTEQNPRVTFTTAGLRTVTLTVRDSLGAPDASPARVDVDVAPQPPVASGDTYTVQSGQSLAVATPGVLGNDTNPGGTGTLRAVVPAEAVTGGAVTLNTDGSFTFTPSSGSTRGTFSYQASNGSAISTSATVTITVTAAAPTPPVAINDPNYTVQAGQVLTVAAPGVLANDSNPAGTGTLTVVTSAGTATGGTVVRRTDGGFTFTPAANATSGSFTYQVTNGTTTSSPATVSVSITPAPLPIATGNRYSTPSGQTLTVPAPGVLADDSNPSGIGTLSAVVPAGPATGGTVTLGADGHFSFMPSAGASSGSFTYRVTNGTQTSADATVIIDITAAQTPTCTDADGDGFYAEGGICGPKDCVDSNPARNPGAVEVCGDGVDNDCDQLVDAADKECNGTDCLARFFANPVVITRASWNAGERELDIQGNQAQAGAAVDVFNAATGALVGSTTTTASGTWELEREGIAAPPCRVRVTINGQMAEQSVSNAPSNCVGAPAPGTVVANADSYVVSAGTTLTVAAPGVLSNDKPTVTTLTAAVATNPTRGTLNLASDGRFTYTPEAGFSGIVTFAYRASNGSASSEPATVTITVRNDPPNGTITAPAPIARGQSVKFGGSATDPNGDAMTYAWTFGANATPQTSTVQNPSVVFSTTGTHTVTLTVTDSKRLADPTPATVQVSVTAPNRPPEGTIIRPTRAVTVERGHSVSFQGIGSDPDGNTPLTYSWNFGIGSGIADSTLQNPSVRFSRNGTYTVRLTVRDSRGLADPTPATVTVRVVEDD